jgi:hypothetical protein
MIPFVENNYFYSRESNVIYANLDDGDKVPLICLKQKFIDLKILGGQAFDYMNRYLEMFPELWDRIKEEPKQQLTLF